MNKDFKSDFSKNNPTSFVAKLFKAMDEIEIPEVIKNSKNSVVRIDGIAESCSAAMTGTGFIVANERVITNAHVVAGVEDPVISQPNGSSQIQGKVIYINRQKDVAVLFVPGLMGDKLTFMGPVTANELGFVIGYPNGGNIKTIPVSISSSISPFKSSYGSSFKSSSSKSSSSSESIILLELNSLAFLVSSSTSSGSSVFFLLVFLF